MQQVLNRFFDPNFHLKNILLFFILLVSVWIWSFAKYPTYDYTNNEVYKNQTLVQNVIKFIAKNSTRTYTELGEYIAVTSVVFDISKETSIEILKSNEELSFDRWDAILGGSLSIAGQVMNELDKTGKVDQGTQMDFWEYAIQLGLMEQKFPIEEEGNLKERFRLVDEAFKSIMELIIINDEVLNEIDEVRDHLGDVDAALN